MTRERSHKLLPRYFTSAGSRLAAPTTLAKHPMRTQHGPLLTLGEGYGMRDGLVHRRAT